MSRRIDIAPHLHAEIGDNGVAELVLGPEGGMPTTDARGCQDRQQSPGHAAQPGRCSRLRAQHLPAEGSQGQWNHRHLLRAVWWNNHHLD